MTRINLLPWRQTLVRERDTRFYSLTGASLIITLAILGAVHIGIGNIINQQAERNHFLKTNLDQLGHLARQAENLKKTLVTQQDTLNKLISIQELRTDRLTLMTALANSIPAQVYLTEWVEMNNTQTLSGWAQSEAFVADFMHKIETIPHIHKAELTILENDHQESSRHYGARFWIKLTTSLDITETSRTRQADTAPHIK